MSYYLNFYLLSDTKQVHRHLIHVMYQVGNYRLFGTEETI
jgi:hypothetical protein